MFNYFMLIGKVQTITKNTIYLDTKHGVLEVICPDTLDISNIKVGDIVAVRGSIYQMGLVVDRIVHPGEISCTV